MKRIKNLFNIFKRKHTKKSKNKFIHFCVTSTKDKSGRYRYHIWIDGKRCKQNLIFETWVDSRWVDRY